VAVVAVRGQVAEEEVIAVDSEGHELTRAERGLGRARAYSCHLAVVEALHFSA